MRSKHGTHSNILWLFNWSTWETTIKRRGDLTFWQGLPNCDRMLVSPLRKANLELREWNTAERTKRFPIVGQLDVWQLLTSYLCHIVLNQPETRIESRNTMTPQHPMRAVWLVDCMQWHQNNTNRFGSDSGAILELTWQLLDRL